MENQSRYWFVKERSQNQTSMILAQKFLIYLPVDTVYLKHARRAILKSSYQQKCLKKKVIFSLVICLIGTIGLHLTLGNIPVFRNEWHVIYIFTGATRYTHSLCIIPGVYYVGLLWDKSQSNSRKKRSCFDNGRQKRSLCVEPKEAPKPVNITKIPTYNPDTDMNYTLSTQQFNCLYWSGKEWTSKGCKVIGFSVGSNFL